MSLRLDERYLHEARPELKPNNPAAIARGLRQARGYARQLDRATIDIRRPDGSIQKVHIG